MQSIIFITLSMMAMSVAISVAVVSPGQEIVQTDPIVDFAPLMNAAVNIQYNLDMLVQLLNEAEQDVLAHPPHAIRKRQTEVSGNVEAGPNGPRGNVDVSHKSGGTSVNANVNTDRSGTGYGAGVEHTSQDGNTKVGAHVNRDSNGQTSGGFGFKHRFRK